MKTEWIRTEGLVAENYSSEFGGESMNIGKDSDRGFKYRRIVGRNPEESL
ncbi:MAG: hypothetical protein Q4A32_05995 [Lachnospiraceae bacterium]|nr:hypothetical protein [Lachnospiraceae bacterium]